MTRHHKLKQAKVDRYDFDFFFFGGEGGGGGVGNIRSDSRRRDS